ncbi:MAG: DNA polymerase III subunit epsilon [Paracoccus sp. (in: a-proteobacteria)]|uniref:DNA polymerase III subunit epsilon n=1 Tax=Paracoccus sp. TaxID=267 RepID=UPI0026E07F43|nr:DNA polymerase III subunit epsilon [Paracoccus sp. (in: a-proteobacteria)]MDO5612593.1 DNA polymerase III subunit epsilon [Paracoccus sp. (in: a-proteobacteria)]
MREIVFDTETTGTEPDKGDRIVEIGAIELLNHLPTGRHFHEYIDPERPMPAEAFAVHGLGDDFLRGKPKFAQIAARWIEFIGPDTKLIAHNARFDFGFINAEFRRIGQPPLDNGRMIDTLAMARAKFPGAGNSLDALCRRFGIDNSNRDLHGALIDTHLLAEVYLELIGGRQPDLILAPQPQKSEEQTIAAPVASMPAGPRPSPLPPRLTESESAAHAEFVSKLGENAIWRRWMPG